MNESVFHVCGNLGKFWKSLGNMFRVVCRNPVFVRLFN